MKSTMATMLPILAAVYGCTAGGPGDDASRELTPAPEPLTLASNDHFEGIWQGMLTSYLSGSSSEAVVIVNGWGEFRLVSGPAQFVGGLQRTANSIAGTLTGIRAAGSTWTDGSQSREFYLEGTIAEDDFIEARIDAGGDGGTVALAWGGYAESDIDSIVGTWVQHDDNDNIVASFQVERHNVWEAGFYGSDVDGCTYSGVTEAWTSRYAYDLATIEVSGCPADAGLDPNGTYSGLGALLDPVDDASEATALVIALSNELQHQVTFFLYRVSE